MLGTVVMVGGIVLALANVASIAVLSFPYGFWVGVGLVVLGLVLKRRARARAGDAQHELAAVAGVGAFYGHHGGDGSHGHHGVHGGGDVGGGFDGGGI
jgi:hypothetical protein